MTQTIVNLGTGGAVLNGSNGSTGGADSNDALFLDWDGGNYVYLPGVSGNRITVPHESALNITGDLDVRVKVAMDDWTPSANVALAQRTTYVDPNQAWNFLLEPNGRLTLGWYPTGSGASGLSATSSVATGLTDGSISWVRVTLDVDNGAAGRDVKFFTSIDGMTWTQLGTTVTAAGVTSLPSVTSTNRFAAPNSGHFAGKFYRGQVLDGINGTSVLDVDTSVITSGSATSFLALTGQTVAIDRSTSGRKSVAVVSPVWLFGTDDYMEVADNDLLDFGATDSFTVLAVIRQWNTPTNFGQYAHKRDSGSVGFGYASSSTTLGTNAIVDDGPTAVNRSAAAVTQGITNVSGFIVDRSLQTIAAFNGATLSATSSISSVGSLVNAVPLRIGRTSSGAAAYQDFELLAVSVFRRALTATEIAAITTYYQSRWP